MEGRKFVLSLLLLVAVLAAGIGGVPRANSALVGTVCIVASNTTGCPASSAAITGGRAVAGSSVTVAINVAGSDTLSGFDISVQTDPNVLNATGISFSGTVVPPPLIVLVDCINNVSQSGASCQPGIDRKGVASLGILSQGGTTVPPTTGLFFDITYSITGNTTSSPVIFEMNSGCSGQSVSGTNDCVLVTSGPSTIPENAQTATFANLPHLSCRPVQVPLASAKALPASLPLPPLASTALSAR